MNRTERDYPKECCLCGPSRFSRVLSLRLTTWKSTFALWRCRSCDLEFLWPQPNGVVVNLYDENYYRNGYLAHETDRREQFRGLLRQLRQRGASGPLLDVGAGIGLLVSEARQENWIAEGIEPSMAACQLARELYGIHLACGEITEMGPSPEFGLVVLWQVLAHVPHPLGVLQHAVKMLRPAGMLVLSCIHWGDPHYRLATLLTQWKKVNAIHIPTILWRFRQEHLEELARQAGLRVQSLEYGSRPFREPFGWKRRLLEQGFGAYREMRGTHEEMQLWCKQSAENPWGTVLNGSSRPEMRDALSQAPLHRCAETAL